MSFELLPNQRKSRNSLMLLVEDAYLRYIYIIRSSALSSVIKIPKKTSGLEYSKTKADCCTMRFKSSIFVL